MPHLPYPRQRQALRYYCKELLYGGAARGGKSDYLLMAALQGVRVPGYAALLLRKTYQDLSLPGALLDRSHQWWTGTDAHWDGDHKTWLFPTGARIAFGYLDGPTDHLRYQGADFQYVGIDEASQLHEKQALYLLSRLTLPNGFPIPCRYRLATNPGGIGHEWIKKRFQVPTEGSSVAIEQRKAGDVLRAFVPALARDNLAIDVEDYLSNLRLLDPITRAQLEEGKWIADNSGLVYYCYAPACNVDRLPAHIPVAEWCYVLGVDFAATIDKTAFAVTAYTPYEPEVFLDWTEEHTGMSPSDAARRINELTEQFGGFQAVVGDSGGMGAAYILEMQKHWALPIVAAEKQHKLAFIRLFNGELANGRFKVVAPHCETWTKQATNLMWADGKQEKENQSQPNDSTDAGLYSWRECRHYATAQREEDKQPVNPFAAHKQALMDRHNKDEWNKTGTEWNPWAG